LSQPLTKRMVTALRDLRFECDYEDEHKGGTDNFIRRGQLSADIGEKTLSDLVEMGLVTKGQNKWFGDIGYRITENGRKALR